MDNLEILPLRHLDLAWAAGFVDGEGWIGIKRLVQRRRTDGSAYGCNENYEACLSVAQNDPAPLVKLHKLFGGSIKLHHRQQNQRISYVWQVRSKRSEKVCEELMPFFVVKRGQAAVLLAFRETIRYDSTAGLSEKTVQMRRNLYERMKGLNSGRPWIPTPTGGPNDRTEALVAQSG